MTLIKHHVKIYSAEYTNLPGHACRPSPLSIASADSMTPMYQVIVDNQVLVQSASAGSVLADIYKTHIGDYPKFHKMDPLCQVGFVASELLLQAEGQRGKQCGESRGIVLFNATSSLADDRNYQATIDTPETSFPSPSLFVYTLPNVLTGEIAIRNRYFGETNFIVLPEFDCKSISNAIEMSFSDPLLQSLVTGWVDCYNKTVFDVLMFLVDRDIIGHGAELSEEIKRLRDCIPASTH